jgi:tetratricopeptide (TPR) repeat protein
MVALRISAFADDGQAYKSFSEPDIRTVDGIIHKVMFVVRGNFMFRVIYFAAAALLGFCLAALPAAADDSNTCERKSGADAIAACSRIIKRGQNTLFSYYNRGKAYHNKKEYDKAIADFDQAIKLSPDNFINYHSRGEAHAGKGDYDRAIADYDQGLKLAPKHADGYYDRAEAYAAKGDYARAIADYDQTLNLDAGLAKARQGRERAQAAQQEQAKIEAARAAAEAAKRASDDAFACKYDPSKENAIAACGREIERNPKDAVAYRNRGYAYDRKDDYDRAIADYD